MLSEGAVAGASGINRLTGKPWTVRSGAVVIATGGCAFLSKALGWSALQSLFAGAIIAISSTTIIVKAFEEQGIRGGFTHVVFGILIVEDLIAILLLTILTAASSGEELHALQIVQTAGRLVAFLVALMTVVIGFLFLPETKDIDITKT